MFPRVTELRKNLANSLAQMKAGAPVPQIESEKAVLRLRVRETFYNSYKAYGGDYSENLPGEPDASWDRLVQIFQDQADRVAAPPGDRAIWIPDEKRTRCVQCNKAFGTLTRKHHCRLCGEIFCDACTRNRLDVRNPLDSSKTGRTKGVQTNQRVCKKCFDLATQKTQDVYIQKDTQGDIEAIVRGTRLGERYGGDKVVARFQFVVEEGGGIVLLSRLHRAFAQYFNDCPEGRTAFNAWKIFGEQAAKGRSDSCVVYLNTTFRDHRVKCIWKKYILDNPDLARSVNTSFQASGLYDMGQGAWGLDLPKRSTFRRCCESSQFGESAGFIVGSVLGQGSALALEDFVRKPDAPLTIQSLQEKAQEIVERVVAKVWPDSMPPSPSPPHQSLV